VRDLLWTERGVVACSRMSTGSDVGAIPAGPIKPMNLGSAPLRFSACDLKVMNRMKKRGLLELSGLPFAFFEHPGVGSLEGSHFAASPTFSFRASTYHGHGRGRPSQTAAPSIY